MEFVRRAWTQIRDQAEGLPRSVLLFVGSLLVVLVLVGWIMLLYVGQADRVSLAGMHSGSQAEVMQKLSEAGVQVQNENGQLFVSIDDRDRAFAVLAQADLVSADASEAFNQMLASQNMFLSNRQSEVGYVIAKQQALSRMIRQFNGVQRAEVIIALPQRQGFGASHVRPQASVSVTPGGEGLSRQSTRAIAALISGSVAEMRPQDVQVTDTSTGRLYTVADEDESLPSDVLEYRQALERYHRDKIKDALGGIPGVVVAVNVITDDVRRQVDTETRFAEQALESESKRSEESNSREAAAEPGTRPNTGATIAGADNGPGTTHTLSDNETRFMAPMVSGTTQTERTSQNVEQINAVVSIPRSYFVSLWKAENVDETEPPSDEDLQPVMAGRIAMIEAMVRPLMVADREGELNVSMMADETVLDLPTATAGGGGVMGLVGSQGVQTTGMVALGILAVGVMAFLAKKGMNAEPLPTVEELSGIPPMLATDDDLIGEVDEGEGALAGMEIDEAAVETQRIAQQINDLVKNDPEEAGQLIGRWIEEDEY